MTRYSQVEQVEEVEQGGPRREGQVESERDEVIRKADNDALAIAVFACGVFTISLIVVSVIWYLNSSSNTRADQDMFACLESAYKYYGCSLTHNIVKEDSCRYCGNTHCYTVTFNVFVKYMVEKNCAFLFQSSSSSSSFVNPIECE
jgi:hypothetical protein